MSPAEYVPRPSDNATFMLPAQKNTSEIIRISVSIETAREILKGTDNNIEEYIEKADANNPYRLNPVAGKTLTFKSDVTTSLVGVRNVLGIIEGNKTDEIIVIGAHYDHVGMNAGYIWNGADDNGSGTTGVMTIAKAIMETGIKPEKTIVIALWTAEEMGLIGSEYFMANAASFKKNIRLNMNFDMISRYISDDQPDKAVMTYTNQYDIFRKITEKNLQKYVPGLDLEFQPSDNPPGGTDHRTFVKEGIPIIRIKPGHREEYHTPADDLSTIDWDIMEKIIKLSFADIWTLSNSQW
jgi:Zn-dependent M28 family amino/carboxypeptidase